MTRGDFAEAVFTYCTTMDASVTSAQRTEKHNTKVGGVLLSSHRFGLGADVVYDTPLTIELRANVAARLGLLLLPEIDHDHLQPLNWRPG